MNLTQFLRTEKMLNESYVADATETVVVGYGTFVPCHIGYLCMAAKLVTLAEEHDATPIMVIVEKDQLVREMLPVITKTLASHFPSLTVQVEENVVDPLHRMAQSGKMIKGVVGEEVLVTEALVFHKKLHGVVCEQHVVNMAEYKRASIDAVRRGNFNSFRASILECSFDDALAMYTKLNEVM